MRGGKRAKKWMGERRERTVNCFVVFLLIISNCYLHTLTYREGGDGGRIERGKEGKEVGREKDVMKERERKRRHQYL